MVDVRKMASRSGLSFWLLLVILFTFSACSQPVGKSATLHSSSLASLHQQGESRCIQPPSQVNLQTATDQQLAFWGLPSHETLTNNPALASNLTQLKHRICSSTSPTHVKSESHSRNQLNLSTGTATSRNWAGYVARGNQGTYTEANMYFTVPTLTGAANTTFFSEWVGMGGDSKTNPSELVQAGIYARIDPSGHQTTNAFWEVVGKGLTNTAQPMSLTVNPGDQIWVYVGSNADSDGYDGFLVKDSTQGSYQTAYERDSNAFSDGASAECIVERPTAANTGGLEPLAQFGTISITGCGVYTNGQGGMAAIGDFSTDQINMEGSASTGSLTNGSDFTVTWQGTRS